jgi:aspartate dehydrogenase
MKLTIIGCGSIGKTLATILEGTDDVETMYFLDHKRSRIDALAKECPSVKCAENFEEVLEMSDLIVETASQTAVKEYIPLALEKGKDVIVMSVGAFVDDDFRDKCKILAKQNKCRIYLPSGAVCGIDGITAAAVEDIEEVILMTYKHPDVFKGVKYIQNKDINLKNLKKPVVVFNGFAKDAVKHFPKNINVAATLSLASLGMENTRVKIVIDPKATRNTHRIIAKGKFGEIECWTRNSPFPDNPKTSYLAALSLVSAVKKMMSSLWVGV